MYLKRLEIYGFKSFAEKSALEFLPPHNGKNSITAIVGPNGSGKSNISDAIRWVMGEQSMKQLRGKKSEDIIFAGSEHKGQLGMASVSMVLDNRDGRVPLDYEEIVIGRRIYRSGESEYILNENPVKLIDLQLLLAKAQFGNGSYAVIGQGTIDRLLLQSAQERKEFFDEAAGIREFQMKRHQAFLKLVRTKDHIREADMVLHEIEPRLKTLSRQVKKLEERQTVEMNLRELQEKYYVTQYQIHETEAKQYREKIEAVTNILKEKQLSLTTLQEELARLAREESRADVFDRLQNSYQELLQEKNNKERERIVLQGRMQTEYTRVGQQQVGWLEEKITDLKVKVDSFESLIAAQEKSKTSLEAQSSTLEQKVQTLSENRSKIKSRIQQLEWERNNSKHEQTLFQAMGLTAVQAVLEKKREFGGVYGMLVQLAQADARYELALDVAGGNYLSSLVVEGENIARQCIEYLRQEKLGVATFLPLTTIRPRLDERMREFLFHPGVHGIASELIKFDKNFQNIFDFVFGSTLIVEDAAVAKEIGVGKVRMVTIEGDIFERNGSIRGGFRARRTTGVSFTNHSLSLSQGRDYEFEIKEYELQLNQIEAEYEQLSNELREIQAQKRLSQEKHVIHVEEKNALLQELSRFEQDYAISTMSPENFGSIMAQIKEDKEKVEAEIQEIENRIESKMKEIENFQKEEEEKRQRVFHLQDSMQTLQMEINSISSEQHESQIQLTRLETKLEDLTEEVLAELHITLHSILERGITSLSQQEIPNAEAQIQKYKYTLSLIGGIDEEVIKEHEQTKERYDGLSSQLKDLKRALEDLETLIAELDEVMRKRRNKAFRDIKREFERYFKILFDGGESDLIEIYEEESDEIQEIQEIHLEEREETKQKSSDEKKKKILVGIDVIANPPGKKIKNIQALSGGERTMTSLALMCAILRTNPSPFIVLDEVEAALDEANTLRVVNILKELSEASQFVLITHNRVTMHAADALYGVTMGNDGMSRLLSVKLEQAVATTDT